MRHTTHVQVESDMAAGGYVLRSEDVGEGHYSHIGIAIQRDPHPVHGGGIPVEVAYANARLWADAPEMLEVITDLVTLAELYWRTAFAEPRKELTKEQYCAVEALLRSTIARALLIQSAHKD